MRARRELFGGGRHRLGVEPRCTPVADEDDEERVLGRWIVSHGDLPPAQSRGRGCVDAMDEEIVHVVLMRDIDDVDVFLPQLTLRKSKIVPPPYAADDAEAAAALLKFKSHPLLLRVPNGSCADVSLVEGPRELGLACRVSLWAAATRCTQFLSSAPPTRQLLPRALLLCFYLKGQSLF
jgi:hypothetical protein